MLCKEMRFFLLHFCGVSVDSVGILTSIKFLCCKQNGLKTDSVLDVATFFQCFVIMEGCLVLINNF